MLSLPVETAPMMETLQVEIDAACKLETGVMHLPQWKLTEVACESLRILMSLNCMPGYMSVSRLATIISKGDYVFDQNVALV